MNNYDYMFFNLYMSLILLKKTQEAIKNCDKEKTQKLIELGLIYSILCKITINEIKNEKKF